MRNIAILTGLVLAMSCAPTSAPIRPPVEGSIPRSTGALSRPDGASIYWESAGTGPVLLLLHGLGGNHAVWFQQVVHFARNRRVITLSQRGFAPSSAVDGPYDNDILVGDAAAVLDHLGVARADVVGQSMGGWTALGLALERPDLVSSLVLSGTIAGVFDAQTREHYESVVARARALGATPPPLAVHPALGPNFSRRDPASAYLYQLLASFGAPAPGEVAAGLGRTSFDDAVLARLQSPATFVVGEGDPIFPPAIVRRAAVRLGDAKVVVIEDSGHSPYFEQPAAWNHAVDAALVRQP